MKHNSTYRTVHIVACLFTLAGAPQTFAAGPDSYRTLILTGDAAPETSGTLTNISLGGFGESGYFTLRADINDGSDSGQGLWIGQEGNLELIARSGITAPGVPVGSTFRDFGLRQANTSGQMIFYADTTQGEGIWFYDGQTTSLVIRDGDLVPGQDLGATFGLDDSTFIGLSDTGRVLIETQVSGQGPDQAFIGGDPLDMDLLYRAGQDTAPWTTPDRPVLDYLDRYTSPDGNTYMFSQTTWDGADYSTREHNGYWMLQDGVASQFFRPIGPDGIDAPGIPNRTLYDFNRVLDVNDQAGVLATGYIIDVIPPDIGDETALYLIADGLAKPIAIPNATAPGTNGLVFRGTDTIAGSRMPRAGVVHDDDTVYFIAGLADPVRSSGEGTGLFVSDSEGNLDVVIYETNIVPGTTNLVVERLFDRLTMDAEGNVYFSAYVGDNIAPRLTETAAFGIFDGELVVLAKPGDFFDVSRTPGVVDLREVRFAGADAIAGGTFRLSLTFTDGTKATLLPNQIPEPGTAGLLLISGCLLMRRRRSTR